MQSFKLRITGKFVNSKDISQIANIVLFGGNGDEGIEIRSLGYQIYYEYTEKGIAETMQSKQKFNEFIKTFKGIEDEKKEAVKISDDGE